MDKRLEAIFSRRSVRKFTPEKLTKEDITALLEAAMAAPSACCKDPWEFVVIENPDMLAKMATELPNAPFLPAAAAAIIVCGDLDKAHESLLSYMLQDCSAAIENILLGVDILGLGACWIGIHPRENRIAFLKELFKLPESVLPIGIIALGNVETKPEPRTRFKPERVHFESWS